MRTSKQPKNKNLRLENGYNTVDQQMESFATTRGMRKMFPTQQTKRQKQVASVCGIFRIRETQNEDMTCDLFTLLHFVFIFKVLISFIFLFMASIFFS